MSSLITACCANLAPGRFASSFHLGDRRTLPSEFFPIAFTLVAAVCVLFAGGQFARADLLVVPVGSSLSVRTGGAMSRTGPIPSETVDSDQDSQGATLNDLSASAAIAHTITGGSITADQSATAGWTSPASGTVDFFENRYDFSMSSGQGYVRVGGVNVGWFYTFEIDRPLTAVFELTASGSDNNLLAWSGSFSFKLDGSEFDVVHLTGPDGLVFNATIVQPLDAGIHTLSIQPFNSVSVGSVGSFQRTNQFQGIVAWAIVPEPAGSIHLATALGTLLVGLLIRTARARSRAIAAV